MHNLTLAPLPEWNNLLKACFKPVLNDHQLAKPWCREDDIPFWFSRSAWSLDAIVRWRQKMFAKQEIRVWIPDYFCNASLEPLRKNGAYLVFYPVTLDFLPDIVSCESTAKDHSVDIFLHVHYFGQVKEIETSASFCKRHDAWLVEDAVHVLYSVPYVGEAGDFVLYSPHKTLPIPDGACLIVRSKGVSELKLDDAEIISLKEVIMLQQSILPPHSARQFLYWLLKRVAQKMWLQGKMSQTKFDDLAEPNSVHLNHSAMSTFSKRLLGGFHEQLENISQKRKENTFTWSIALDESHGLADDGFNVDEATPYLAPFRFVKGFDKRKVFDQLQLSGIPATTWPDLPPEVLANPNEHQNAIKLRLSHLFLPVHQSLLSGSIVRLGRNQLLKETKEWQITKLEKPEWESYRLRCRKSNLLQSWEYGTAKEQADNWQAKRYLVTDNNGQAIALLQVLIKYLPLIGGVSRINRGPLLIADSNDEVDQKELVKKVLSVLCVFKKEMSRHRWWFLQAAVELPDTELSRHGMQMLNFKKSKSASWASGILDLALDEYELLMRLRARWRRHIRKGEKLGVIVHERIVDEANLQLLLNKYSDLQTSRCFDGLSESMIRALSKQNGDQWKFNLFEAVEENQDGKEDHLGILVSIHTSNTAIYLIGYANERGRKMQANSAMLWKAILLAKISGCKWFDIGGLSEETPKGIAEFKRGLQAEPYRLTGEWKKFNLINQI